MKTTIYLFVTSIVAINSQFSSDYCLLQKQYCRANKHVACSQNSFSYTWPRTNFELIEMTPQHRSFILDAFNDYRSRIALGRVEGFPMAGNMPLLIWQREFEYLMEEVTVKAEYGKFYCVSTEEFKRPYETAYQYLGNTSTEDFLSRAVNKFIKKEIKDNYDLLFSTFYNANINKIGCAAGRYISDGKLKNVFRCLVNQWAQAPLNSSYEFKETCTKCNKGEECDSFYQGLCIVRHIGLPGVQGPPGPPGPTGEDYYDDDDDCEDDQDDDEDCD